VSLNIVIIGAGEVGFNIAKSLSKEDYEITVIDVNPQKCLRVRNTIDAKVIEGDCTSQRLLSKIDMFEVDYVLALTRIDEVNLVASQISSKMGAKHIICRLRNTEYIHKNAIISPLDFNISYVTYPEMAAKNDIEHIIKKGSEDEVHEFKDGKINMIGFHLEENSPIVERTVKDVEVSNPFIQHKLALVYRDDESFIPTSDTIYKKNDFIYIVGRTEDISEIQKMTGNPNYDIKNIMILGCGKIGRLLAKSLQTDYSVTLVEKKSNKAKEFSSKLSDTLMLSGDGLDVDFLEAEEISRMDCFIAATESEQTNLLSSLIVKDYGVKQIIMHITTTDYYKVLKKIGVGTVISKNISAVNEILNYIRTEQENVKISRYEDLDIEAIEIKVEEYCRYLEEDYSISGIPKNVSLCAIIRSDKIIIPGQNVKIEIDDELLFFAKPKDIGTIEDLFQR
tara:strand:+ start:2262 stop:3614 length:1353 start_codon:yes stop_codon:yes gene_type:complete